MKLLHWLQKARRPHRLKLAETLALGDHRIAAILSVDGREFLVGATAHSVSLLSELMPEADLRTDTPVLFAVPPDTNPPSVQ